jgi:hypothetical protein
MCFQLSGLALANRMADRHAAARMDRAHLHTSAKMAALGGRREQEGAQGRTGFGRRRASIGVVMLDPGPPGCRRTVRFDPPASCRETHMRRW